jgi:diadenosine tetraphosphatase ApaH/serine/threonine PP2A family protein phosphatase
MKGLSEEDYAYYEKLTAADIAWMKSLPLSIHIKDNWYALHAGLEPAYDFNKQNPSLVMRCRYVNAKGKAVALNKDKSQPDGTTFWADSWEGRESIVFGHTVFDEPKVFRNKNNICIGIDTGCVYGGHLTAFFLDRFEFVQVKAKKVYFEK